MRFTFLSTAAVALITALSVAPATAQSPKPSRPTNWTGMDHPVVSSAADTVTQPHWEYRYGYDRHAAWRGHWVLVR